MRRIFQLLCATIIGLAASGCVAAAAIMAKTTGDPKMPAEYAPPPKTPLVVLVENYDNADLYEVQGERLERDITFELKDNKVGPMIDPRELMDLRNREGNALHKMNIPDIGKAVRARQVIYVNLLEFRAEPAVGSDVMRGTARALVKVVDTGTGRTLWPPDTSAGREVKFETPDIHHFEDTATAQEKLYETLGDKIARLFYDAPVNSADLNEPE